MANFEGKTAACRKVMFAGHGEVVNPGGDPRRFRR
jgi:hypothetical protein